MGSGSSAEKGESRARERTYEDADDDCNNINLQIVELDKVENVEVKMNESPWITSTVILNEDSIKIMDGTNVTTEVKLTECPILSVQKTETWELVVTCNAVNVRLKTRSEAEAHEWLKIIRYQIMIAAENDDVFTSKMIDMTEQFHAIRVSEEELAAPVPLKMSNITPPNLTIIILVVGTRGDVQPFVYLGQHLKRDGHRVRLATHAEYREDVVGGGLEYYPLAGDPRKLSEYMVKTGGRLIPDLLSKEERMDLPEKMRMLREICFSCEPACTAADPEDPLLLPFTADAIISNPVSYGHIHCAQALGVPLHIMFPQPWSPTRCFPHPLSNLGFESSWSSKNYYSYLMVDEFMWLGLGGMINAFRRKLLHLPPVRFGEHGESLLNIWQVPISHMWSPSFVPACRDWPHHVDVVGEFRPTDATPAAPYTPAAALVKFLAEGDPPVYIGFGSMVIEDSKRLVAAVLEAAAALPCRVLLQNGWTKYGEECSMLSPQVMVIGAMPHDYLFAQVAGVVHHGGAGTTSAGLRAGNPTFICPFFGDQHFWAEMVFRAGAGPRGCPVKDLTAAKLSESLRNLRDLQTQQRARALGAQMVKENGVAAGAASFYRNLPLDTMICDVSIFQSGEGALRSRLARVHCPACGLKMCAEVDAVVHRADGPRATHSREPYLSKHWGPHGAKKKKLAQSQRGSHALAPLSPSEGPEGREGSSDIVASPAHRGALSLKSVKHTLSGVFGSLLPHSHSSPSLSSALDTKSTTGVVSELNPAVVGVEQAYARATAFLTFWRKLDADGSASVDETELAAFLPSKRDAAVLMQMADWNGDHSLSFAELAWILAERPSLAPGTALGSS